MSRGDDAHDLFRGGCACSQAVLMAYAPIIGLDAGAAAKLAAGFAAGMRSGGTCGAVTGATMVLGSALCEGDCATRDGRDVLAAPIRAFTDRFAEKMGALDCPGILGCDLRTPEGMASAEQEGLFDTVCVDAVREAARILEDVISVAQADALVDGEGARVRESAARIAPSLVPCIRLYRESDWPSIWPFLHATVAAGETYAFPPQSSETEMHRAWIDTPRATYVACSPDGRVLGTYYLKPNHPGPGSHVCNCGFVVAQEAQGRGIATAMCAHAQVEAVALGFRAMQFNLVVCTNTRAISLWRRLGFSVVGTLPGAFHHQRLGFVDALVMFKELVS
ncbi:MAG TPA: C-GCAxxG-C-C family (seleno)protein [Thermoleophilia bacterium]|nr:C-GCAxxG-C-C family (seleno)protein [Thermoleophilia bacterium]